jgi:hypothetical protein
MDPSMTGPTEVGFSITPVVTIDAWGGSGVSVTWIMTEVGVHEGTNVNRGTTVAVAVVKAGFEVAGGNGFRLLFGSTYIRKKTDTTQIVVNNTKIVKTFHTKPERLFLRGSSFASENSYPSI